LISLVLSGCGGSAASTGAAPSSAPASATPSPTPTPEGDFCDHIDLIGEVAHVVKKGTETGDELIAHIQDVQATLLNDEVSIGADLESKKAFDDLLDSLGSLKRQISIAGDRYPYDPVVQISKKGMQFTALTAALRICG
jgi:hypothetical protein